MSRDWADSDYVRVYHTIKVDPKFKAVWGDKVALGWYLTLLMSADQAYPVPADLPRIPDIELAKLVDAGVVVLGDADTFTVKGMVAEREARTSAQSVAGKARAATAEREKGRFTSRLDQLPTSALVPASTSVTSLAEQSKAKQSSSLAGAREGDSVSQETTTKRPETRDERVLREMDERRRQWAAQEEPERPSKNKFESMAELLASIGPVEEGRA